MRILTLLLSIGLIVFEMNLSGQTVDFTVSGIAIAGISIVGPASPGFEQLSVGLISAASAPGANKLLPYSAVLTNDTDHTIIAYSLRWVLTDRGGKTETRHQTWWNLIDFKTGDAIPAHSHRLVSLVYRLGMDHGPTPAALNSTLENLLPLLQNQATIQLSLDAIVTEDGKVFGPDLTHTQAKVEAQFRAEIDVSRGVLAAAATTNPEVALNEFLSRFFDLNSPSVAQSQAPPDADAEYYNMFSRGIATNFRSILRRGGLNAAWAVGSKMAAKNRPQIRRG